MKVVNEKSNLLIFVDPEEIQSILPENICKYEKDEIIPEELRERLSAEPLDYNKGFKKIYNIISKYLFFKPNLVSLEIGSFSGCPPNLPSVESYIDGKNLVLTVNGLHRLLDKIHALNYNEKPIKGKFDDMEITIYSMRYLSAELSLKYL